MVEGIAFYGQIVAGLLLLVTAVSWGYSLYKKTKLTVLPTSVDSAIEKITTYADEAVAWSSAQTLAILFKKHGDPESAAKVAELTSKVLLWDDGVV